MKYAKYLVLWLAIFARAAMAMPVSHGDIGVPAGTTITIRLEKALSSDRNLSGEQFRANLALPLIVNGRVIAKQGSEVRGRILGVSGRNDATAYLVLELYQLVLADGRFESVATEPLARRSEAHSTGSQSWNFPAVGTSIGAAVGKGRGAALGATIGASLRGLSATGMRVQPVVIKPSELLVFRLK
jgi:hypothetical protein